MALRLKPATKLAIVLLVAVAAVYLRARTWIEPGVMASGAAVETRRGALTAGMRTQSRFKLALSEWPGHMPFVIGNGGLTTAPGSIAAEHGLDLEISFIEDATGKNQALREKRVDFVWQTVDEMPIHMGAFRKVGAEVRAFLQLDWSRGGDACVASADVRNVEDLLGRKSAMLMFSPDHTVFEFMIGNSRLTPAQIKQVRADTAFSMTDFTFGRVMFAQGKADVACLWEPDVSLALKSRKDSHVLFSTADASALIADVLLTSKALLDERPEVASQLAGLWFASVTRAEADRSAAARLVSNVVPRFRDELGYDGTLRSFEWTKWTKSADNAHFFGVDGESPLFDRLYKQFDETWTAYPEAKISERFLASSLRDDRAVRSHWKGEDARASSDPSYDAELARTGEALFTKPVTINYSRSSAALDAESLYIINSQILPQLEMTRAMHIRVEGNTDSLGNTEANRALSEQRAKAVSDYLISKGIDSKRISHRGNGDTAPIASNKTLDGRAANRRTDILFIRALENR
jgi:outer membrane protein OmpA-like peptidoglycan-associated protein/ABC-type nitrate/sulfonate/bicarbonate transport system substrate-binding protein